MSECLFDTTVCAPATAGGGALAVVRLSGPEAFSIADKVFTSVNRKPLSTLAGYKATYGSVYKDGQLLDEVIVTVFKAPHSYTGEDSVEFSCHGSSYIVQEILSLLIDNGAAMASAGEFTKRAFVNGKMDLAQAEAVADLIASETAGAHALAVNQMKGGFSRELTAMRERMLHIVSLMELELDFSEEEVEFADRSELDNLLNAVIGHIDHLVKSFTLGNVIKNGVPVAIAGATNTGKSTLLNALLGEERAIVSPIHGTTRDAIEDTVNIGGTLFRFIDTAGIRKTKGTIEIIGIERTFEKIRKAGIVLLMLDATRPEKFRDSIESLRERFDCASQKLIILVNKTDKVRKAKSTDVHNCNRDWDDRINRLCGQATLLSSAFGLTPEAVIPISAKDSKGLSELKDALLKAIDSMSVAPGDVLVTNMRHVEALNEANTALLRAQEAFHSSTPTDLIAQDIREALFHIGTIVGTITTDEVLGNIFKNFCIGK